MSVRLSAWPPKFLAVALFALIAIDAMAQALQVPELTGRVVDQADILTSDAESRLAGKLETFEGKTSIQLVVVTLASLQDQPIEEWGLTLGRTWGIGQKGEDNGALLIVAPNDRELRIEVGYGLEGTLPDATADAIVRNVIVPRFKAGEMAGGISDGVDAIIAVLTGTGEEFTPAPREAAGRTLSAWAPMMFGGFFIVMMIVGQFRRRSRRRKGGRYYRNRHGGWLYMGAAAGAAGLAGRGGFGGGGFGGGGFGGGGGSFGGGGASGQW